MVHVKVGQHFLDEVTRLEQEIKAASDQAVKDRLNLELGKLFREAAGRRFRSAEDEARP